MVEYLNLFSLLGALLKCSWEIFPSARPFLLDTNLSLSTFLFPLSLSLSTFLFPFSLYLSVSFLSMDYSSYKLYLLLTIQLLFLPTHLPRDLKKMENGGKRTTVFIICPSHPPEAAQSRECPHLSGSPLPSCSPCNKPFPFSLFLNFHMRTHSL